MSDNTQDTVIVVGGGLSGLATALAVALQGRQVTVFEAAELVGGAAAYSGGQVWVGANHVAEREGIDDDLGRVERYVRAIASSDPGALDEETMLRWLTTAPIAMRFWEDVGAIRWTVIPGLADYHHEADGAIEAGRYLTNEVIDGSRLGAWRSRLLVSPYFPVGTTYAEMFARGRRMAYVDDAEGVPEHAGVPAFGLPDRASDGDIASEGDPLTFGTGVVASFLARVIQLQNIEILTSHPVVALLRDGDHVVGVRAQGPEGIVQRRGPVVLATSSFDWDDALVKELLSVDPEDFGSVAPRSLRGDGIKLARSVGGAVRRLPATSVPMLPGWPSEVGTGYGYGPEFALPHAMIVDRSGHRYCNDSYWVDIVSKTLDPKDRHLPFFLIWDSQHHRKYGLGATPPGGPYPAGMITSAPTLSQLGAALGVDGEQLRRTAKRYSDYAERGEDPDYGRGSVAFVERFAGDPANKPNPVLGPIVEAPFYGVRLKIVGTGIGLSGVSVNADGHVLDDGGAPIPGLHAVGTCAAMTASGSGYNSGFALGRALTLAYLVAEELAGENRAGS